MTKQYEEMFSSRSFLLIAHYATYAMQDLLYEYFTKYKVSRITKINLPLPELPYLRHIEIIQAEKGKIKKITKLPSLYKPKLLAYFLQSAELLFWCLSSNRVYDVSIAQDSLLAAVAIILRFFKKCKIIIFYSHGVDSTRFKNPLLLGLYKMIDKFSATHSDYILVLSQKMIAVRKKQGISRNRIFWVPASIPIDSIKRKANAKGRKLVFIGTLNRKNGVYILPSVIAYLKDQGLDVSLDIMGDGPDRQSLEQEIKKRNLANNIRLLGHLTFQEFGDKLTDYHTGIVSYEFSEDNLLQLTDSMKLRLYTAAGLPIVITKGFDFSTEVEKNGLGIAVPFGVEAFAKSLYQLLTDTNLASKMRKTALLYSKKYDLHTFYQRAFSRILEDKKLG